MLAKSIQPTPPAVRILYRKRGRAAVALVASLVIFSTSPLWCQNTPACPACSNWCGQVCLDGMKCSDGTPEQCQGGTQPYCPTSPIIVDPLGQGFHLTDMAEGVRFTFNGQLLQTSWTDEHYSNAWLALDRNGNGVIDDASELFGEFTPQPPSVHPNGYKALAVFDDPQNGGNGNGRIDPGDAIYPHLLLWVDRNHDGISQPDELITLPEAGVFAISLDYTETDRMDRFGNFFRFLSTIWDEYGGKDPWMYDVFLMVPAPGPPPSIYAQTQ